MLSSKTFKAARRVVAFFILLNDTTFPPKISYVSFETICY